jgi:hypothetical protein
MVIKKENMNKHSATTGNNNKIRCLADITYYKSANGGEYGNSYINTLKDSLYYQYIGNDEYPGL